MQKSRWIREIPLAVALYNKYASLRRLIAERKVIKQLTSTPYLRGEQIASALNARRRKLETQNQEWVERIEHERHMLMSRNDQLDDGSLGIGGLYDEGVTIRQVCSASKSPRSALFLFLLTLTTRAANVIELGTNVGISSSFIGAALTVNAYNGRITTLDASPYRQRLAMEMHRNLGLENVAYVQGPFKDTLAATLKRLVDVDLAFIDGHHQYQPTLDYYEEILQFARPDAVLIFDDIRWSEGMKRAWAHIQADLRFGLIVDLDSIGVCVYDPTQSRRFLVGPITI